MDFSGLLRIRYGVWGVRFELGFNVYQVGFVGSFGVYFFRAFRGIPLSTLAISMVFRWVRFVIFYFDLNREAEAERRPGNTKYAKICGMGSMDWVGTEFWPQ